MKFLNKQKKTKLSYLLFFYLFSAITLVAFYLFLPKNYQSLNDRMRDFFFHFRGKENVSSLVVIVDIDERSLKELGQWPWERDKVATILKNLTNAKAGIIGLDIVFAEADKTSPSKILQQYHLSQRNLPDYDAILAQTVATTPTILGYLFSFDVENKNEAPNIPAIFIQKNKPKTAFLPKAKGVITNIDILQNQSYSSGFINNIPDEMGIIRSVPLFIEYQGQIYPSLAFEMYRIAMGVKKVVLNYSEAGLENIQLSDHLIKTDRFGRMYVNFKGRSKSYKYLSAVDIYNNHFDPKDIQGKFILVGTSAYGLMDLRSTPMDNVIAGVEIHANVIDNLLKKDMLVKPYWSEIVNIGLILGVLFIVLFLFSFLSLSLLIIAFFMLLFGIFYFEYNILFSHFIMLNILFPLLSAFIAFLGLLIIDYFLEYKQKEMIKQSFSKKVSKQVMEDLLEHIDSVSFASREENVSIYFSDIRSFTTISEKLQSPKKITTFLNYYMDEMVNIIQKYNGTIDKFIGDAIMAYWNAPIKVQDHADKVVQTALEQIAQREHINQKIKQEFGFEIDFGIGINTGDVVVGEIGSQGRSDYTVIGDAVNLASRLEGLCKVYSVRLVVSQYTIESLKGSYVIQLLDRVRVKGKTEPIKIYEIISQGKPTLKKQEELDKYNQAYELYLQSKFHQAYEAFRKLYDEYKKPLYQIYFQRSQELQRKNIKDFDGVYTFTTK